MEHLPQYPEVGLDPLKHLPLEVMGFINDSLDPPDTERLRRVCKSWKILSETLNDKRAIARHCPKAYGLFAANSGNPNLYFRRWLCFEQNIVAGLAQNAVQLYDVMFWDIRNHMLVVGHSCGKLLVRQLRQSTVSTPDEVRPLCLKSINWPPKLGKRRPGKIVLKGVFATVDGEIVIYFAAGGNGYISRITSTGEIVWFIDHEWSALAVDRNHVYVLKTGNAFIQTCKIVTLHIGDGTQISSCTIPALKRAPNAKGSLRLVLSADEGFILIKKKNHVLCIYDTAGQVIRDIEEPIPLDYSPALASWVTPEPESSNYFELCWAARGPTMLCKYTYSPDNKTFIRTRFRHWSMSDNTLAPRGGVDVHRGLVFEDVFVSSQVSKFVVRPWQDRSCGRQRDGLLTFHEDPNSGSSERRIFTLDDNEQQRGGTYHKFFTVPDKRGGKRHELEFPAKGVVNKKALEVTDFFGVYNDYVVFFHAWTGRLMVMDFWPSW